MMPIRLTLGDVGDVDFDDGNRDGMDTVGQGDGSVGVGSRIQYYGVKLTVGLLKLVDEAALVVRLVIGKLVLRKTLDKLGQILPKRHGAIDFRLAFA